MFEIYLVGVESLGMHVVGSVLIGQVEEDTEGEVEVVGVGEAGLLPQPDEAPLLGGGLLGAVQGQLHVAAVAAQARLLDQLVHLANGSEW